MFSFADHPVAIEKLVTRAEFERWITPELKAIAECVDRLMAKTTMAAARVDRAFLTGGCVIRTGSAADLPVPLRRRENPHRRRVHLSRPRPRAEGAGLDCQARRANNVRYMR